MRGPVNLAHLDHLLEEVEINGRPAGIVHIYAEAPSYDWVDASNEGIAAVDDVARAALVYLEYGRQTGDATALEKARRCLNFVLALQADDGEFYNFVTDRAATINRTGPTSLKSLGWWAARGAWSLAAGAAAFQGRDARYAEELRVAYLRSESRLAREMIARYNTFSKLHGVEVPGWFIGEGADATATMLLGLVAYQRAYPNPTTVRIITQLANGLARYRLGDALEYPFGAHPASATSTARWNAWGAVQIRALAEASVVLGAAADPAWLASARAGADEFSARLVAGEMWAELSVLPQRRGQIAYGQTSLVRSLLALSEATGEERYARLAGLAAAWYDGDNIAATPMYDPATGRVFDGIDAVLRVNRNSGAESTIEGLDGLLAVAVVPQAARYRGARTVAGARPIVIEAEDGRDVSGRSERRSADSTGEARWSRGVYLELKRGDAVGVALPGDVPADDYYLYAAHLHQAAKARVLDTEALRAPAGLSVDGDLADWAEATWVAAEGPENILRGGGGWPGPKQSFRFALAWDDERLYLAVQVRDDEHRQRHTGAEVWQGDTLWLYFDASPDRTRLTSKFTLAQTPDGPQVWSWIGGGPVTQAKMAWAPQPDGYIYEASFPREMVIPGKEAGATFGFEIGRGFDGGFMDWTGRDPDVARSLGAVTLTQRAGTVQREVEEGLEPGSVALEVALPGGEVVRVPAIVSPDRDFLWLDRVGSGTVRLRGGDELRFAFAGNARTRTAAVDGFLLMPATLWREYEVGGRRVRVSMNVARARTTIEDPAPAP